MQGMESVMANQVEEKQWYLAVGDRSLGPLSTDLVSRGIRSGKVPTSAWVCQVGDSSWSAISSFDEFQDALTVALAAASPANEAETGEAVSAQGVGSAPSESMEPEESPYRASAEHLRAGNAQAAFAEPSGSERDSHAELIGSGDAPEPAEDPAEDLDDATGRRSLLPYERTSSVSPPEALASDGQGHREARGIDFLADSAPLPSFESEPEGELNRPFLSDTPRSRRADPDQGFDSVFGPAAAEREATSSFSDISEQRPVDRALRFDFPVEPSTAREVDASLGDVASTHSERGGAHDEELGIDIVFDPDDADAIDWKERFQSYFLVGQDVKLPEETLLLASLRETPRTIFLHDEALWNLALCLAFGSDAVAEESAVTFFDALTPGEANAGERVQWICRTLLSKGFMPSGIPRLEGLRGIDVLRQICPIDLQELLERESAST